MDIMDKLLEVVVGASHLPDNNLLEEQKQAFPQKIVLLLFQARNSFEGGRKNGAHVRCVSSSFRRSRGLTAVEEERLTADALSSLEAPVGKRYGERGSRKVELDISRHP
jgi:hypothetical protein